MKLKILSIVSFAIVMMLCISHLEARAYIDLDEKDTTLPYLTGGQIYDCTWNEGSTTRWGYFIKGKTPAQHCKYLEDGSWQEIPNCRANFEKVINAYNAGIATCQPRKTVKKMHRIDGFFCTAEVDSNNRMLNGSCSARNDSRLMTQEERSRRLEQAQRKLEQMYWK